jgi:hypothetical protein
VVGTAQPGRSASVPAGVAQSNLQLCTDFLRLEEDLDLFRQTIDGVYFWEHVRFYVFYELQRCLGLVDTVPFRQANPGLRWAQHLFSSLTGLVLNNPYFTTQKPYFFFGCPRRIPDKSGVWWDITVDPFLDSLAAPAYYIERYCGDRHCKPPRTKAVKYQDLFSMIACGYRMATFFRGFSRGAGQLLLRIQARLESEFGVNVHVPGITLPILKARRALSGMYEGLLRRVQPRAVFVASVNYYERIAIEACKRLGIPVIELQHGVIGPFDLCYVFPKHVPLRCFPDYLFVYGTYWRTCLEYPLPQDRIVAIGNPFLEARLEECRYLQKTDQAVIVSQPPVGVELSRFAVALKRDAKFPWPIVYRLHPFETDWRTRYPWLKDSGISVSESRDGGIHEVLAESRMQIGVYSAALVEGLSFGLTTYLVNLPGVEYMQPFIDRKWARLVGEPGEVSIRNCPETADGDEAFYCRDSLRRFQQAVEAILSAGHAGVSR